MYERVTYSPPPTNASSAREDAESSTRQLGTILFEGAVPPTKGAWLGIEWDDASRGKHSGVHEKTGVRYFEPRVEGAGSFLRADAKGLDRRGKTFKQALWHKYLEVDLLAPPEAPTLPVQRHAPPSLASDEPTSQRYATNNGFDVEVVLNSKVTEHFKQLNRLREIGLEWESVCRAHDHGEEAQLEELGHQLSRLDVLNLSYSMLPSLPEVDRIVAVLPRLRHLVLNSNRFMRIATPTLLPAFNGLTSLQLNSTLLSWPELLNAASSLSNLVDLQVGYNRICTLSTRTDSERTHDHHRDGPPLPKLERLNLEGNELANWEDMVTELAVLPSLKELVLSSNRFSSLTPPSSSDSSLRQVRHLSLSNNLLSTWSTSINIIAATATSTLPSLSSLRLGGNPLVSLQDETDPAARRHALQSRLFTIARLPCLDELEGTAVTAAERDDAERFWLDCSRSGGGQVDDPSDWERARLKELEKKHGLAPASSIAPSPKKQKPVMKDRLIQLCILLDPSIPASSSTPLPELAVLPSLRTLILRTQISRLLGQPLPKTRFKLVAFLQGGTDGKRVEVEIPPSEEGKEVSWWGLQNGDSVLVAPL
ncbi:hypothetical protein JCM11251_003662 [Rhodosporidiobolus azoricus]